MTESPDIFSSTAPVELTTLGNFHNQLDWSAEAIAARRTIHTVAPNGEARLPGDLTTNGNSHQSLRTIDRKTAEKSAEDNLRQVIEAEVEALRNMIESQIAQLESRQHETELSDQIDHLKGKLSLLDPALFRSSGGSLAELMDMRVTLGSSLAATSTNAAATMSRASFETAHHAVELTTDKLVAMNAVEIAQMQAHHDRRAAAFRDYEVQSNQHIESLAAANGVDITGYRETRAQSQEEYEQAKRDNDRVAMAASNASLATNDLAALIKSGASEEKIEVAQNKRAENREIFLREEMEKARKAGVADGLTGDDLTRHVENARRSGIAKRDEEDRKIIDANGLSPRQQQQMLDEIETSRAIHKGNRNSRTNEHSTGIAQAVKAARSENVTLSDRQMLEQSDENGLDPFAMSDPFAVAELQPVATSGPMQTALTQAKQTGADKAEATHDNQADDQTVQQPAVPNQVAATKGVNSPPTS